MGANHQALLMIDATPGAGDPYWTLVTFLLNFQGSDGSTSFPDTSSLGVFLSRTLTASGNAQINNNQGLFDGTGDYLSTNVVTGVTPTVGDFTLDCVVEPASVTGLHTIITSRSASGSDYGFFLFTSGTAVHFNSWGPTPGTVLINMNGGTLSSGVAAHIEVSRNGSNWYLFVGGTQVDTDTSANAMVHSNPIQVGRDPSTSGREWNGRMHAVRFTDTVCRHTANFTPPTAPFPEST